MQTTLTRFPVAIKLKNGKSYRVQFRPTNQDWIIHGLDDDNVVVVPTSRALAMMGNIVYGSVDDMSRLIGEFVD